MAWVKSPLRVTVKAPGLGVMPVAVSPASLSVAATVIIGRSSLVIVPTPVALVIVALVTLLRLTVKASGFSLLVSPTTATVTVLLISPGAKLMVAFAAL